MSESLGKAVLDLSVDNAAYNSSMDAAESRTKQSADKMEKTLQKVSMAMVAAGAAIAAALGVAVKAAEEQRIGIERLESTLLNVGVAYGEVREELEANIAAMQRKTGVGDSEQRDALNSLIITTNDYKRALELLPLAIDLAAAKEMDLKTASELVGRVAEGNTTILTRYGMQLEEGATAAEALAMLQERVGGTAEAMASPIDIAKAAVGDLGEAIGDVLLPKFNELLNENVIPFVEKLIEWVEANDWVVDAVAKLAGALIAGGGIIAAMIMLSKAIAAVNAALIIMQSLSGIGIVKVLGGLAVAAGAIVGMNKLMSQSSSNLETELAAQVPSMDSGGIVPGPIGAPVLLQARGGERYAGIGGTGFGGGIQINFGNYMGDDMSRRQLIRDLEQFFDENEQRSTYKPSKTETWGNRI